jgi:hypothetical protein
MPINKVPPLQMLLVLTNGVVERLPNKASLLTAPGELVAPQQTSDLVPGQVLTS